MNDLPIFLKNIIAVTPVPMAIVDTQMRYLAVSDKWVNFYALEDIELIGKSHYDVFPEIEDRWKKIHAACLKGEDRKCKEDKFERLDGSIMWLKWEVRHWLDDQGNIGGLMMYSEDVTSSANITMNERRFQLFMDELPGLCWITDHQGILKYANKCFFDTLHLPADAVGKHLEAIFGLEIARNAQLNNVTILESGENKEFHQTLRDQHGHPQYYKTYKFPFQDHTGEGTMVGAVAFNITKRIKLEEELQQSEAQFKQAFEHSLIGMALISPEGRWKKVNKSLTQILGYSESELKELSIQDITHPDDLSDSISILDRLATGKIAEMKYEKRYIHKDGNPVWVVIAATMLYDSLGRPLHYVSQIEDITKRKEIENDLLLSEKKYRTIFENVQDVFYQTDQQGMVVEISPSIEQHSGYPRHEIIGMPVANFYYYPNDRERIVEELRINGFVIDFEVRLKTRNEELRYASVNARLIVENGEITGTEGSMRDVTTRKFHENALRALNTELTASNEQKK